MAHVTISVPEEHVDDLRRHLLRAHARCAAALRRALDAYLRSHERFDAVEGAVVELADLDEALHQVGWSAGREPRAVVLRAHPEVLVDALRALVDAHGSLTLRELLLSVEREG
jgi:hypothetical protein